MLAYPIAQGLYPAMPGEVGIIDDSYPVGHVSRYGIYPDGVTDWATAYPSRMLAVLQNSLLFEIYWPRGFYATGINWSSAYSGSMMYFDKADFGSIVHVVSGAAPTVGDAPIIGLMLRGSIGTYDRAGVVNCQDSYLFDEIHIKSDGAKHTVYPGTKSRGFHGHWGNKNLIIGKIIVDDCGNINNTGAAIALDGAAADPQYRSNNISIAGIRIKASDCHGLYCAWRAVTLGDIRVDGYGAVSCAVQMEDSDSLAQSAECCGIWFNRAYGRVGHCTAQAGGSGRANAKYDIRIDETDIPPYEGLLTLGDLILPAVGVGGTAHGGLVLGDVAAPTAGRVNAVCGDVDVTLATGAAITAGHWLVHLASSGGTSHQIRLAVRGRIRFVKAAAQPCLGVAAQTMLAVVGGIECDDHAGQLAYIAGAGRMSYLRSVQTGSTPPAPVIDIQAPSGRLDRFGVDVYKNPTSPITQIGLRMVGASNVQISPCSLEGLRNGAGVIALQNTTNCRIENLSLKGPTAAPGAGMLGLRLTTANTGLQIDGGLITGHDTGIAHTGSLTGCAFYGVRSVGNLAAQTTLSAGSVATDGACSGVTL